MARVPLSIVPSEPIASTPPEDYERIQSSPADFGGLIGQAAERAGSETQQSAGNLAQIAEIQQTRYNANATTQAVNSLQTQAEALTYGDKNDPSAPAGLYTLKGADAMKAGPQVTQKINDLRDTISSNLANDAQRLQFQNETNRYLQYKRAEIANHIDQQANQYGLDSNNAAISVAGTLAGNAWNNDDHIASSAADASSAAFRNVLLKSGAPPDPATATKDQVDAYNNIKQSAQLAATTHVIKQAVASALASDPMAGPVRAAQILQKFGPLIDPLERESIARVTKGATEESSVAAGIDEAFGGPPRAVAGGGAPQVPKAAPVDAGTQMRAQAVHDEVVKQGGTDAEGWGWAANAVHESAANPAPKPGDGGISHGMFQLNKDQLAAYEATHNGHLPEQDDMATQLAWARGRAIIPSKPQTADDWAKAISINFEVPKGGVGEAANRGATAVALSGAQPATPATTGAAPAGAPQRNPAAFGMEQQIMDNAYAIAAQRFPDNPQRQGQLVNGVWEKIQRTNMLQAKQEADQDKARRDAQEGILNGAITTLNADPTKFDPSVLDARDAAGGYVLTPQQRDSMHNIVKAKYAEHGIEDTAPYGPGYAKAYHDILAASAAPGKISTLGDLFQRGDPEGNTPTDQRLTSQGIDRLTKVLIGSQKSIDERGLAQTENSLLQLAERRLKFPDVTVAPGYQVTDRVGQDIFNGKFLPEFYRQLDKVRATGKPEDLDKFLTADTVNKMADGMRSQADIDKARLEATGMAGSEATPEKPGTPLPPVPTIIGQDGKPVTISPEAWQTVMVRPPNTPQGVPYSHKAWADTLQRMLANPEKGVKDFDTAQNRDGSLKFAGQGYDGATILKALTAGGSAVTAVPPTQQGAGAVAGAGQHIGPFTLGAISGEGAYRGRFKIMDAAGHDIGFTGSHEEAQAELAKLNAAKASGWNFHLPNIPMPHMHHEPGIMSGLPAGGTTP